MADLNQAVGDIYTWARQNVTQGVVSWGAAAGRRAVLGSSELEKVKQRLEDEVGGAVRWGGTANGQQVAGGV